MASDMNFSIESCGPYTRAQVGWETGNPSWIMIRTAHFFALWAEDQDVLCRVSDAPNATQYRIGRAAGKTQALALLTKFMQSQEEQE